MSHPEVDKVREAPEKYFRSVLGHRGCTNVSQGGLQMCHRSVCKCVTGGLQMCHRSVCKCVTGGAQMCHRGVCKCVTGRCANWKLVKLFMKCKNVWIPTVFTNKVCSTKTKHYDFSISYVWLEFSVTQIYTSQMITNFWSTPSCQIWKPMFTLPFLEKVTHTHQRFRNFQILHHTTTAIIFSKHTLYTTKTQIIAQQLISTDAAVESVTKFF